VKTAIIGAGLQCNRRAPIIKDCNDTELVAIANSHKDTPQSLADKFECPIIDNWKEVIERQDIEIIVVCTPPHVHAEISIAAMKAGKHVLCEKPLSRTIAEAQEMVNVSHETGKILKCGFNHRHHPAIAEGKRILDSGDIGEPIFSRCRYGIIGRPDYAKEWRADPNQAAGGQFIEQGTHAIDLFRWFLGELVQVACMTGNQYFVDQSMEDNGMAIFRSSSGALASLHTSLTQWKNLFSFEVFGGNGYLQVEGLGGGYGNERLIVGKRDFHKPFQDQVTEYRGGDISWREEWKEFLRSIKENRPPLGNGEDGLAAMRIALASYESEQKNLILSI